MSAGRFSDFDHECMARALELARRALYTTDPNPRVGCVLAHDGLIIAEGFHARAGDPHAERNALATAGEHALIDLDLDRAGLAGGRRLRRRGAGDHGQNGDAGQKSVQTH